ncbi:MAG: isochorismate synthase [Spirulinaceae cyanobacterium RM2_2_10]|nr:isochorismate synthase [Spirulinaceae cyanobacterium RM2_2_10]
MQFVLVANFDLSTPGEPTTTLSRLDRLLATIESVRQQPAVASTTTTHFLTAPDLSFHPFVPATRAALAAIQAEQLSKIVLAQPLDVVAAGALDPIATLARLRQHYPDCTCFSLSNGRGSYFLGASPERLASIRDRHLVVDALAGSAPRGRDAIEDARFAQQLLNSDKDRREHQAVSHYLSEQLQSLGLRPQLAPRQLRQLSNIQHLWTPITAQLPAQVQPLEVVAQLHPTPAVAGVPTAAACEQIRHYENFERGLYAAPIGWLDMQGNSEFVVGIRSALLSGARARLYAGAGIVAGSDPDREQAEVQLKLQAMLAALGLCG